MIRIGILFGGRSREREVSFAGGRTVFDCLDKDLFHPVPIFIDSLGNPVLLEWQYLYKGSIRDFYPPSKTLPDSPHNYQIYVESLPADQDMDELISLVGKRISYEDLPKFIDFAFLTLHGPYGEDGSIQGVLEYLNIPYSGSGIFPSAVGIDKTIQKKLFKNSGFNPISYQIIKRNEWFKKEQHELYNEIKGAIGFPVVVKSASQGSSLGVSIVRNPDFLEFKAAVDQSLFVKEIFSSEWADLSETEEVEFVRRLCDLQVGIGLPIKINDEVWYHPEEVLSALRAIFSDDSSERKSVLMESLQIEPAVIFEAFIEGKEFSCIVIQDENGDPLALPPTEIRKRTGFFDYRAKYLPGISSKITPIDLPGEQLENIRDECSKLFKYFNFNVYARIDGFIKDDGTIYLNDPNTTSGMLPSSFFFHQAAEIGLNPSQFLTYITYTSLSERAKYSFFSYGHQKKLEKLTLNLKELKREKKEKQKIAVILGGYSSERHISVESGRNVYEKLSSSEEFEPMPIFLSRKDGKLIFHKIPVNILLKDNADDIREKIEHFKMQNVIKEIINESKPIREKFSSSGYNFFPEEVTLEDLSDEVDFVFLALHGRPGEDGTLQKEFINLHIPFNGSEPESALLTIDKYATNKLLRSKGISVANNLFITKENWEIRRNVILKEIADSIHYPLIAKPSDDGCSSAVKKIINEKQLMDYVSVIFRDTEMMPENYRGSIQIKPNEEFPRKDYFIVESLIGGEDCKKILEITGGMLNHFDEEGKAFWEIFEPSEALAGEGILSLEEKFLAGEGQNITPARFDKDPKENKRISEFVKNKLKEVAEIAQVSGYCRIDAFVKIFEDGKIDVVVIEINSLPGLTPATAIFHQAALNGYRPIDFLNKIISFGIKKMELQGASA